MIIDMTDWLKAERQPPSAEGATTTTEGPPQPPPKTEPSEEDKVAIEERRFDSCPHKKFTIDDVQRTVKCGDCKMWLDPVWCLRELFRYYEQRVDRRVALIEKYERKAREAEERREERRKQPRRERALTMAQNLERAAYNEYQSKILAARAAHQRVLAGKIEKELMAEDAEQAL